MNGVLSNWKLTINPAGSAIVLLDYDQVLAEEPEWNLQIGLNVVRIPFGAPHFELTDQDVYSLSLTLLNTAATDAEARQAMIEALTDRYDTLGKVALRLEIRGLATRRYDFGEAVFSNPRVRRALDDDEDGAAAWTLSHTITAKTLTKTVIP